VHFVGFTVGIILSLIFSLPEAFMFFQRDKLSLLNVSWKFRINWYLEQLLITIIVNTLYL
jgi:hypothetical protein